MSDFSFEAIATAALSQARSLVQDWMPGGKLHGVEYRCGGIDGSPGESFSINLNTGRWSDFATGDKGGDLISLFAARNSVSQLESARRIAALLGHNPTADQPAKQSSVWTPIIPVPAHAAPPPAAHFRYGMPTHTARYLDCDGGLVGLIYRCEPKDAKKEIYPLTFCERIDGRQEWRWLSFPKPRMLYGAELLSRSGRILIVEGEPKADTARRVIGDRMVIVAWPGGAQAVSHADWSLLANRDCIIWPDADSAGYNAAAQITIQLRHHNATARTVVLPEDVPKGWDLGDAIAEGWAEDAIMRQIDPPVEQEYDPEFEEDYGEPESDFIPMGHDRGKFYFFTMGSGQVRDFTARDLQSAGPLLEIAPLRYWEMNYPGKGEAGFNSRSAGDALMRGCYKVGIYDPNRLRGRGAWLDEGRSVLHIGGKCIVDGVLSSIVVPNSRYIYEHSPYLDMDLGEPLSTPEANMLRELCVAAPWEAPDHMGQLLAGWCVIAPVCGAMPWRPHLWLASEAGGGKTWCLDNIIKPVIGPIALEVQSKTTEAGIRQTLGCDARPVIFDEAETQNDADRSRVQHVLDLARQASSEEGAAIIKGSSSGKAMLYHIRSCFVFSSINVGMSQSADESRTVVLTLSPHPDPAVRAAAFAKLKALHTKTMTPGFAGRLLARTLSLLPVIRQNAVIFAEAIARSGKPRRAGDTYGVLMAGAWSLRSRLVATPEEADRMVADTQWVKDAVVKGDVEPEWDRALSVLIQHRTRYRHDDVPIGELIDWARTNVDGANDALMRLGIKVEAGGRNLLVANRSTACAEIFARTAWSASWASTIGRAPGVKRDAANVRFYGKQSKVMSIPIDRIT